MSDEPKVTKPAEIDFFTNTSLQKSIKKTKKKQIIMYIFISVVSTTILLMVVLLGSQYILSNRIGNQDSIYFQIHGANISYESTSYSHNLFSVIAETTYKKNLGDRSIIWNKTTEKIPVFGRKDMIDNSSGKIEINHYNEKAQRTVRYNNFNNERKIDFYYPKLTYDYLPDELNIAVGLDKNQLIEIALSFKDPINAAELQERLGNENVNWLWADTTTSAQMAKMEKENNGDSVKTKGGGGALGFKVGQESPYSEANSQQFIKMLEEMSVTGHHKNTIKNALKGIEENTQTSNGKIRFNGAVVTGTPEELKRFQDLDFIRASVLGATIDQY